MPDAPKGYLRIITNFYTGNTYLNLGEMNEQGDLHCLCTVDLGVKDQIRLAYALIATICEIESHVDISYVIKQDETETVTCTIRTENKSTETKAMADIYLSIEVKYADGVSEKFQYGQKALSSLYVWTMIKYLSPMMDIVDEIASVRTDVDKDRMYKDATENASGGISFPSELPVYVADASQLNIGYLCDTHTQK